MATSRLMPRITRAEIDKVENAVAGLRGQGRARARELMEDMTPAGLCTTLHAMRRWYSYNCWNNAKKILPYRDMLGVDAMKMRAPVGAFRGFKVSKTSELLDGLDEGDVIDLPVERNGGCSSWTEDRDIANRFSGASQGKVGLVIQLAHKRGVTPFIAPPKATSAWFNNLYAATMGRSFRFNEEEWAIHAPVMRVRIVAIKRK